MLWAVPNERRMLSKAAGEQRPAILRGSNMKVLSAVGS
jgi:hypothetical protein